MAPSSSLLWSVNVQVRSWHETSKSACGGLLAGGGGGAFTSTGESVCAPAPSSSVIVNLTVYRAAAGKVWLGACSVEPCPSPKSHDQVATRPSLSLLASVKPQVRPSQCQWKSAFGGLFPDTGADMSCSAVP